MIEGADLLAVRSLLTPRSLPNHRLASARLRVTGRTADVRFGRVGNGATGAGSTRMMGDSPGCQGGSGVFCLRIPPVVLYANVSTVVELSWLACSFTCCMILVVFSLFRVTPSRRRLHAG